MCACEQKEQTVDTKWSIVFSSLVVIHLDGNRQEMSHRKTSATINKKDGDGEKRKTH